MPVSDWITEPKKNDQWSTVAGLRSQKEKARRSMPLGGDEVEQGWRQFEDTPLHEEHKY
jgi:hypothetical protein